MKGEIKDFTGVSPDAPYEAPLKPELHLDSDKLSVEKCVEALLDTLEKRGTFTN